jgi:hypothetical protein
MSTYKEIVYMVLDELKLNSDDAYFTEEHVIFLASKYRAFLLKQKYADIKKQISESNYQTICLDVEEVPAISGELCSDSSYLKTKTKIPTLLSIGNPRVFAEDYYQGEITYVSRERMKYVGYNKYLQNIIYASIGPDGYLYLKSFNPQFLYLEKIQFTGIFEDAEEAAELSCDSDSDENTSCDILDKEFSIEEALIPPLIELIVKEIGNSVYQVEDTQNNANDDQASNTLAARRNLSNRYANTAVQ